MGFLIPVPSYVNSLQFTWDSSPPSPNKLFYTITTTSSSTLALPSPNINISTSGIVPENPQTWSVALQCSGLEAGEVVVGVNIDISGLDTADPLNVTNLKFKRKKTCHMYTIEEETIQAEDTVPTYVVFFAGVGGCLFVLVLVLSLVIGSWLRGISQSRTTSNGHEVSKNTEYTALPPPPDIVQPNNSGMSQVSNNVRPTYMTSTLLPPSHRSGGDGTDPDWSREELPVSPPIEKLVVDRLDLTLGDLLLEGTFGRVYQGRLTLTGVGPRDVMVKTIIMGSSESQAVKLINDGSLLYPVSHKHVLPLLATTSDGTSPMMIYEYLHPGNMKKWLSGCHQPVSTHQCVTIGLH